MDARTLSVKTIFGQDRQDVIPLFQSPYVWQRKTQLAPLWEDIRAVAERLVAVRYLERVRECVWRRLARRGSARGILSP